ncbi:hypothetical protein vseg_010739 [Gypsophila vaccaria]
MARNSASKTASKSSMLRNITTRRGIAAKNKDLNPSLNKDGNGPNDQEAIKHGSIQNIVGVTPFNLSDADEEHSVQPNNGSELESEDKSGEWYVVHGRNIEKLVEDEDNELLELEPEEVQEDIEYWSQAVYGFVLGSNPPITVLEGFLRRIWKHHDIDRICFMPTGVFLVRFKSKEIQEKVLNAGYYMFDNKPVIIKPWQEDVDLEKEEVKTVPAWIRLHKLSIQYWGKSLARIAGLIGRYLKNDVYTDTTTRLGYARVLVEIKVDQKLPNSIKFIDEKKNIREIMVEYEWKPITCKSCKKMGHETGVCRVKKVQSTPAQQVWRKKEPTALVTVEPPTQSNHEQEQNTEHPPMVQNKEQPERHTNDHIQKKGNPTYADKLQNKEVTAMVSTSQPAQPNYQ